MFPNLYLVSSSSNYHPEKYWSEVAERIDSRGDYNFLAGDDTPFYRYKRKRFLDLFHKIDFKDKAVLEIGCGPGGNLVEVLKGKPKQLHAADISENMISLARKNLENKNVQFSKINGTVLPFENQFFDVVFSVTVLQHNTDDEMMRSILQEMCRVSKDKVILFERVEHSIKGDELCLGRPVEYYASIAAPQGYEIEKTEFINIEASYLVSGSIRKLLNPSSRKEGQSFTKIADISQRLSLPITSVIDRFVKRKRDLAMIILKRK